MNEKPNKRPWQFSIKTLLVVTTIIGVLLGLGAHHLVFWVFGQFIPDFFDFALFEPLHLLFVILTVLMIKVAIAGVFLQTERLAAIGMLMPFFIFASWYSMQIHWIHAYISSGERIASLIWFVILMVPIFVLLVVDSFRKSAKKESRAIARTQLLIFMIFSLFIIAASFDLILHIIELMPLSWEVFWHGKD